MPNKRVNLDLQGTLDGPPGAPFFIIKGKTPFFIIKGKNRRFTNRKGTIKIQAFQIPISNAGIADMIHLLSQPSEVVGSDIEAKHIQILNLISWLF